MDFDSLETVDRANTIKNRATTWRLKRSQRANGPTFTFNQELVSQLDLRHNSLVQRQDPNNQGNVYIAVAPGNEGTWAKLTAKGGKGNSFKNEELAKALDVRGMTDANLDLTYVGIDPKTGWYYYQIVPYGQVVDTTAVAFTLTPADNAPQGDTQEASMETASEPAPDEGIDMDDSPGEMEEAEPEAERADGDEF